MKTRITVSVDKEVKDKVFDIIHYQNKQSFSAWVNDQLIKYLKENGTTN